jgi:hypothetical protein
MDEGVVVFMVQTEEMEDFVLAAAAADQAVFVRDDIP